MAPPALHWELLRPQPLLSNPSTSSRQCTPSWGQAPTRRRRCHLTGRVAAAAAPSVGKGSGAAGQQQAAITQDYLRWATEAGITSPKLTQAFFGELRGAQALEATSPDEVLVTVPRAAALVVAPRERCPCPDFIDPGVYKEAPWWAKMAVLLLAEAGKGRASPLWGYVEQLPGGIDTPVRWKEEELAQLQYAPAIAEVKKQQGEWRAQHTRLAAAVQPGSSSGGTASPSSTATPSSSTALPWERFVWAAENVRSRSFSGPWTGSSFGEKARTLGLAAAAGGAYVAVQGVPLEQALNAFISVLVFNIIYDLLLSKKLKWYALCPVVDAINHNSLVESEVAFEYFKDCFALSTSAAYKQGEQVFISYGAKSNDSLLQYYGFVEAGNPNDTYKLSAALGGRQVELVVTGKGSLAPDSLAAAREALGAAGQDPQQLQAALLAAFESELSSLPTRLANDERSLQTPHLLGPRQRMALQFRAEKKRLLERGAARARKRAAAKQQQPAPAAAEAAG